MMQNGRINTLKGHRGGSIVKDDTIKELRDVGYLSTNIATHAPSANQLVLSPHTVERLVFVPHLIRGVAPIRS